MAGSPFLPEPVPSSGEVQLHARYQHATLAQAGIQGLLDALVACAQVLRFGRGCMLHGIAKVQAVMLILWAIRSISGTTRWVPAVSVPAGLPSRRRVYTWPSGMRLTLSA